MKTDSFSEGFVREGFKKYPEAKMTTRYFEERVLEAIEQSFKSATWPTVLGVDGQGPFKSGSGGNDAPWISVTAVGETPKKEDLEIEVGLVWVPPKGPIIYGQVFRGPERFLAFSGKPTNSTVAKVAIGRKRQRLVIDVDAKTEEELGESVSLVLEELLRCLSAVGESS